MTRSFTLRFKLRHFCLIQIDNLYFFQPETECHEQRCKIAQKLAGLGGRKRKFVLSSSAKRNFFFSRRILGEFFLCSANLGEAKIGEIFAEFRLVIFAEIRRVSPRFFRLDFLAEIRLDSPSFFAEIRRVSPRVCFIKNLPLNNCFNLGN